MRQRNIVQYQSQLTNTEKMADKFPQLSGWEESWVGFQAKVGLSLDQCGTDHRPLLLPSTNEAKI